MFFALLRHVSERCVVSAMHERRQLDWGNMCVINVILLLMKDTSNSRGRPTIPIISIANNAGKITVAKPPNHKCK